VLRTAPTQDTSFSTCRPLRPSYSSGTDLSDRRTTRPASLPVL
jgi:hypothetical protein